MIEQRQDRRARERERRRVEILAAARSVFAEKGFSQATIEEIAGACEVSPGTIYLYFRSKEELYVSLLFQAMDLFEAGFAQIRDSRRRPERKVRAIWDFFYDFYTDYPELYRVFLFLHSERLREVLSDSVVTDVNTRSARNFFIAGEIIAEAVASGVYRKVEPLEAVDTLWSLFIGLAHQYETRLNLGVRGFELKSAHRHAFGFIEHGLLAVKTGSGGGAAS